MSQPQGPGHLQKLAEGILSSADFVTVESETFYASPPSNLAFALSFFFPLKQIEILLRHQMFCVCERVQTLDMVKWAMFLGSLKLLPYLHIFVCSIWPYLAFHWAVTFCFSMP